MSRAGREAVRRMRRDLHRDRSVPALYLQTVDSVPVACTVRTHDRIEAQGALNAGSVNGYAQIQDQAPRLVFLVDDAPPTLLRGAIVSVEAGEAYRIALAHPAHDITVTCDVTKLTAAESAGLPVPA